MLQRPFVYLLKTSQNLDIFKRIKIELPKTGFTFFVRLELVTNWSYIFIKKSQDSPGELVTRF